MDPLKQPGTLYGAYRRYPRAMAADEIAPDRPFLSAHDAARFVMTDLEERFRNGNLRFTVGGRSLYLQALAEIYRTGELKVNGWA